MTNKEQILILAGKGGFSSSFLSNVPYKYSGLEPLRWLLWLTELQKWFREIHDIHVEISVGGKFDSDNNIYESSIVYSWCEESDEDWLPENTFDTYEEALEDAIVGAFKALDEKQ